MNLMTRMRANQPMNDVIEFEAPALALMGTAGPRRNVIPYKPRAWQWTAHNSLKRFNLYVCHRRSGKTEFAVNELQRKALTVPNTHYAYIAPTADQVRSIAWDRLKNYAKHVNGIGFNESFMIVRYPNGSTIRLFGAHEPDRLRGQGFHGVVMDETQDLPDILWDEILLPTLAGKDNWFVIILGTPKGRNLFFKLYEKGLKKKKTWHVQKLTVADTFYDQTFDFKIFSENMSEEKKMQEWYCDFFANTSATYYYDYIIKAREQNRISTEIKYDSNFPVFTAWDIGIRDLTCIWFFQKIAGKFHFIDYLENNNTSLLEWIKVVKGKGYNYGAHFAPHDMRNRDFTIGVSRANFALQHGVNFTITPSIGFEDGIEAARILLPHCYFNPVKCEAGIVALENYKAKTDRKTGTVFDQPDHDNFSHGADAFRYAAVNMIKLPGGFSQGSLFGTRKTK